jgi:hypothetical protein
LSSLTGSIGKGKTDSTYASVTEQAGIFAGKDGFDIYVGKNTDLKGAVIASDATPDKNKLSTDTLTYSDIQNKAEYDSSSVGVSVNTKPDAKINEKGITPNIGVKASGDADSTTKSAISPGTIEVRSNPNQDLSTLSRDTTNSLNALGKIFDKKTVKEQQELAGLFGELAFEEVHKLSKKNGWDEGSPQKIALHALVGGIMSELAGSGFTAGAKGAGFNEAIQKELSKIKDPALHQWASYIIGSAVGGTVGGATAVSGTKNNLLAYISFKNELETKVKNLLGTEDGEKVYAAIDQALMELPNYTSDEIPNKNEDVDAAGVIRNVLNQKGIAGDKADQIVGYYLQKVDETHSTLDSLYKQGRQASIDMVINAGLLATGFAELKALYNAGKITLSMYFYALRYGPTITAEEYTLPEIVITADKVKLSGKLLSSEGKFIDRELEASYQKYLSRKASEGKTLRDRLDWKETRDYWLNDSPMARGNAFNNTAVNERWYDYNEVNLSNGKRLDSYDPIKGEIISRKATNLADVELSTFETYLKELNKKYPEGTIIRSNKYREIDGQPLKGTQILEIPASNKKFSEIQEYIDLAKNKYGVTIRFREE